MEKFQGSGLIRFRWLFILAFFLPSILHAQGVQYTRKEAGDGGTGVPFPVVTVCTSGASYLPLPCAPKASIYSNSTLTLPLANPFRGDAFGNIEFYAAPGTYVVSVTDPYSPGYSFKIVLSVAFDASNINKILYVDGNKYPTLASAIAPCPAAGVIIIDTLVEAFTVNPFSGCANPVWVQFGQGIWTTTVPIVATANQWVTGGGPQSSQIQAIAGFPSGRAIVELGAGLETHSSFVRDIGLACNGIAGCTGLVFDGAQNPAGALNVNVTNYTQDGVRIQQTGASSSGISLRDMQVYSKAGSAPTGSGLNVVAFAGDIVVENFTHNNDHAFPGAQAFLVAGGTGQITFIGSSGEGITDMYRLTGTSPSTIIMATSQNAGSSPGVNTVHVGAGVINYTLINVSQGNSTGAALVDDNRTYTCTGQITYLSVTGGSTKYDFGSCSTIGWTRTPNASVVSADTVQLQAGFTGSNTAYRVLSDLGCTQHSISDDGRITFRGNQSGCFVNTLNNATLGANRTTTFSDISGLAVTEASAAAINTIPKALDATHASLTASSLTDNGTTVTTSETVTVTGPFNCKNFENTQCVDGANSQGWAGADICAWMNSAIGALSAAGGDLYVSAPAATTCNTTTVDGGTKKVFFHFGQMLTTCNVQCIHVTSNGSSIRGLGDATEFIAAAGLPALTPMIFFDGNAAGGNYDHTIAGLYLLNGRDSNVGMLQLLHEVRSNVSDIFADGGTVGFYRSIGVESQDGFSESFRNIRCNNAASAICVGVTAPTMNMSNETVQDVLASNMTAVALNYATTGQPTLTDTTQILNASGTTAGGGQKAQQGVTTVNGAQIAGITSFPVVSGAACFIGYQAWIGLPFDAEWNVVTNVVANTLTLMFPTRQAHSNGERVLCGNVGIEVGQNTTNTFIATPHLEGYGTSIDCHDCQEITILTPNLGISPAESPSFTAVFANGSPIITAANSFVSGQAVSLTTSGTLPVNFATGTSYYVSATGLTGAQFELSATRGGGVITAGSAGTGTQTVNPTTGDGIRFDSVLQATVTSPHLNGFFNTINLTNRVPPWGSAAGVNVIGYTVESSIPGDTNEGIQNNTGIDLNRYGNGCSNTYPTFNFTPLNCPSYQGQTGAVNFVCRSTQPFVAIGSTTVYCNSGTNTLNVIQNGNTAAGQVALTPNLFINSNNTPTVSSGFGTTPTVPSTNSTVAFTVNVGTGGVASSGVVAINGPTTGWNCHVDDITTTSSAVFMTKQTASTATTVTVGNFTNTGATGPWASGDVLQFICAGR